MWKQGCGVRSNWVSITFPATHLKALVVLRGSVDVLLRWNDWHKDSRHFCWWRRQQRCSIWGSLKLDMRQCNGHKSLFMLSFVAFYLPTLFLHVVFLLSSGSVDLLWVYPFFLSLSLTFVNSYEHFWIRHRANKALWNLCARQIVPDVSSMQMLQTTVPSKEKKKKSGTNTFRSDDSPPKTNCLED